ncbi:MAG: PAS domain-containing sensor histidine kinase [Desulfurivibrio sp.]|nr:MAG: PAS domain-containing sensor histidine kinase [Desulfurivibrio sp.]
MTDTGTELQELHRIIIESIADPIFITDDAGNFTHICGNVPELLGYSVKEILAMGNLQQLAGNELFAMLAQTSAREIRNIHCMITGRNGTSHHFLTNVKRVAIRHGSLLFTFHEVSELKNATDALRQSEYQCRHIFDNMGSCMAVYAAVDNGGDFIFRDINPAGLKYSKVTREEVIGKSVRQVFPGIDAIGLLAVFQRVWKTGLPEHHPVSHYQDDRVSQWVENYVFRLPSGEIVAVYDDITERKNVEKEHALLEHKLRHAQKLEAIGTLAGGIAHDFNNILGAILGYAELMTGDVPAGSQLAADLEQILIAGHKAKKLVKQILSFSHRTKVERIPLRLQPLVRETVKLLRSTIPTTIEIRQQIAKDCGSVLADPAQVHQILMNLCTNAYHAMEKTGGVLRIALNKRELSSKDFPEYPHLQSGSFAELVVTDTGAGIDPSIRDKIFEPYFTTKEQGKGTGLGLAILHGIASEYGGAVTVDSVPGQGAAFHVFLPLAQEQRLPGEAADDPLPTGSEHLLFIDDEESLVRLGKKMFTKLGYTVTTRQSSLEALQTFRDTPQQFDLVITDQTMPGLTGADLAVKMLRIRPDIPIILCTGYTNLISVTDAKALGIKEFVMKPLIPADMARMIRQVLDAAPGR